jgi:hypothetical protein
VTTEDPNAILRRIRSSMVRVGRSHPGAIPPAVHDLLQTIENLDDHLSEGGIPPDDWIDVVSRLRRGGPVPEHCPDATP